MNAKRGTAEHRGIRQHEDRSSTYFCSRNRIIAGGKASINSKSKPDAHARIVNIVATVEKKPIMRYGSALLSSAGMAALLEPPAEVLLAPLAEPEREPEAPLAPVVAADPAAEVVKMLSVATAAKSCSDEYVTQLDDERDEVVYGTENVPENGWTQVVRAPLVEKIPGSAMSSLSQTSKVPLMFA